MKRLPLIIVAAMLIVGCYKSILSDTIYPDKGSVVISKILPTDAADPADGFTIIFNGKTISTTTTTTTIDDILEPGVYTAYVYSNHSEVSMENNISESGDGTIISSKVISNGSVESLTEDLYFGTETITVLADQIIYSDVNLWQVTRDILFNFEITEGDPNNIGSVSATLSGIAGQWECVADIPTGDAVNISPTLSVTESLTRASVVDDHLTGSIKVLGIHGDAQLLTIALTFTDGTHQDTTIDVSSQLSGSNSTKSTPIILSNDIETPISGSVDGSIDNWADGQVNGGDQSAN